MSRAIVARKYAVPAELVGLTSQAAYERWLRRISDTHKKRDRKRGNSSAGGEEYRLAIHRAVIASKGCDAYTGEILSWDLISTYNNDASLEGRRAYKALFAQMPTVDHVGDGLGPADFRICAWRTNSAKSDLTETEFIALCARVMAHVNALAPTS